MTGGVFRGSVRRQRMVLTVEGGMHGRSELEGMLSDAAGRLSPTHVAALVSHPEAVRAALAAAADALAADA